MTPLRIIAAALGMMGAASAVSAAAAAIDGDLVYTRQCAPCHAEGMPGTLALQLKYEGVRPARIDRWPDLTPEVTRAVVRNGVGAMPRFRKTEIVDSELDALAARLDRTNRPARSGRRR
jgi:mono/diheme cytochrome c family protein